MDWISYGLEGLTALFTGGAMAWNFAYRSRPKWQPYVVECGYGNPPCLLVKIVNVGNGAATDVHATATHSPENPLWITAERLQLSCRHWRLRVRANQGEGIGDRGKWP